MEAPGGYTLVGSKSTLDKAVAVQILFWTHKFVVLVLKSGVLLLGHNLHMVGFI